MKKLSKQAEKKTNGGKKAVSKVGTKKSSGVVGMASYPNPSTAIIGKVQKKPIAGKAAPKIGGLKKSIKK